MLPQADEDRNELTIDECVHALVALADPLRSDAAVVSLRHGFMDGVSDKPSQAEPGSDPKSYAAGYAFGSELVDILRWTKEIQEDGVKTG